MRKVLLRVCTAQCEYTERDDVPEQERGLERERSLRSEL